LLGRAVAGGVALGAGPVLLGAAERARAAAPGPKEIHLTYGADPTREMTVSWTAPANAHKPRLRFAPAAARTAGDEHAVDSVSIVDRDPRVPKGRWEETVVHHAELRRLEPDTDYVYELMADGMRVRRGTFRTAPAGRAHLHFTAFGDQGTGDGRDTLGAPQGAWIVDQVERRRPLFHLHLGDLAYANLNAAGTRNAGWNRFMANNSRSAAKRPWMPILGNHEIEAGMDQHGYEATLGRLRLPGHNWYAFDAGSVRIICTDAEDWALQKGGDVFLRGYSGGAQLRWLDQELASARQRPHVDWVVLAVHHPVVSSANLNGADLGVRQALMPLLARHDVDFVLAGHDHNYERSFQLGAAEAGSPTLRPEVVDRSLESLDATKGWVHLVLGGGGQKLPTQSYDAEPEQPGEQGRVFDQPGQLLGDGREDVTWVARRDEAHPYGFAEFEVVPGAKRGDMTELRMTYFRLGHGRAGKPVAVDRLTLRRKRG
jgi:3',5'-cyclic AMP phosphodiesterase CpdA